MTQQISTLTSLPPQYQQILDQVAKYPEILTDIQRRLDASEQRNAGLEERVQAQQERISYLEEDNTQRNSEVSRLSGISARQDREIKHLKEHTIGGHINKACAKVEEVAMKIGDDMKNVHWKTVGAKAGAVVAPIAYETALITGAIFSGPAAPAVIVGGQLAMPFIIAGTLEGVRQVETTQYPGGNVRYEYSTHIPHPHTGDHMEGAGRLNS